MNEPEDFTSWFYNQPVLSIKAIKQQIINDCKLDINDRGFCPVLYHWLRKITPVPPLAQEKINLIAGKELKYISKNGLNN